MGAFVLPASSSLMGARAVSSNIRSSWKKVIFVARAKDSSSKSIGQIVDEVADQYFASGMDAFSAGVRACLDVAKFQVELLEGLPKALSGFFDHLEEGDL